MYQSRFPRRGCCVCTFVVVGLVVTVSGCGELRVYPVEGKVSFPDGSPVTGGVVVFESMDDPEKPTAVGPIRQDGTYRLETQQLGPGAVLGRHRVLIQPSNTGVDENTVPEVEFDRRFASFDTSGLEFVVKADENEYSITVERPRRRKP